MLELLPRDPPLLKHSDEDVSNPIPPQDRSTLQEFTQSAREREPVQYGLIAVFSVPSSANVMVHPVKIQKKKLFVSTNHASFSIEIKYILKKYIYSSFEV